MKKCECENIAHFDGNDGHEYAKVPSGITLITDSGTFYVCVDCAKVHS